MNNMRDIKLTKNQIKLMERISGQPHSTLQLSYMYGVNMSVDAIHRCLRRLEDRQLVRRIYESNGIIQWELTHDGRTKLASV